MASTDKRSIYQPFFVARQPIFHERGKIWGYELLFRNTPESDKATIVDGDLATFVVSTCGFIRTQEDSDQTKKVCINFTDSALLMGAPSGLPPAVTVIEVLENTVPSDKLIHALIGFKQEGYLIALDDYEGQSGFKEVLELADIVKVDLLHKSSSELKVICERLAPYRAVKLAEKVDHQAILPELKALGFSLYQGFYFARPEILTGRKINSTQASKFRILKIVEDTSATTETLEKAVCSDPSITYRLLRFLNTAAFGFSIKITSVRHAILLLGQKRIKNWLRMVILSDLIGAKTPELYAMALVRARLLAELCEEQQISIEGADTMFLFGLLSLIEPMLEVSVESLLKHLPLPLELKAGYLEPDSVYHRYLKLLSAMEHADGGQIAALSNELTIDTTALANASVRAMAWANQMSSAIL